jgi:DNA-binding NtrC family response regulator
VVDDDDAILTLVRYCLQREGYQVACASGRAPVLALLAGGHYDLVITDVLMPEIDGTEVLAVTRAHQPDAAVLAMSGGGPHLTAEYCLKLARSLGGATPLEKPFHVEELLTAVQNALQTRARAAARVCDGAAVLM